MYSLAFDTTGAACSIVLLKDRSVLAEFHQNAEFGQAEILMVQLQKMLRDNGLKFADLDLVSVCTGPGSFTGVRSSVAAARAFALACPEVTVCGVNAFEAYVNDLEEDELAEVNVILIETKREDFYVQFYDRNRCKIGAPSAANYEDIVQALQGRKVTFAGDGAERFLSRPSGLSLHFVKLGYAVPVLPLALCALKKFQDKMTDFPKPLYLKAPDVCVK